jgi:predicted DNA-binding ArsR family transcriptional regulator
MNSEGASIYCINFCNRDVVENYFDNLILVMEKHNLVERQIFNVDKTWLSNVPKHSKRLGPKDQEQVVQLFLGNE